MEIIPVVYHHDPEGWWADSPSVPGWSATAPSLDELRTRVEDGVRFALDRDDVIVEHLLEHGMAAHADVVFDFVNNHMIVHKGPRVGTQAHLTQVA
jgi:predicted RNase H-like HicB family nuclease